MPVAIDIDEFLSLSMQHPVLDVRTPAEFQKGHIPGAINLPLFSNEERAVIGTLYKREGKQPAILKGLELVGPKMKDLVKEAKKINNQGIFLMHCWRGGMRSGSVAWLLELCGLKVYTLKGGYKLFRRKIHSTFEKKYPLTVLAGRTGSGKTDVLRALALKGEIVIDLEKLACHKGSSFGQIGESTPPSQETFENLLGWQLMQLKNETNIWIEDESRMIGTKVIPDAFFLQMRAAKAVYLDIPFDVRASYLTKVYGKYSKEELIEATGRIKKRIGPEQCKNAIRLIEEGNLEDSCKISLKYYDKTYDHGLQQRDENNITRLKFDIFDVGEIVNAISYYRSSFITA